MRDTPSPRCVSNQSDLPHWGRGVYQTPPGDKVRLQEKQVDGRSAVCTFTSDNQVEKEAGAGSRGEGGMQETSPPRFFRAGYAPYRTTTLAFASNGFFRIARLNRYG